MDLQRAIDAYQEVADMTITPRHWEWRLLGMPRALGAPFGATAQRQWAKRERIHARLRVARKRK